MSAERKHIFSKLIPGSAPIFTGQSQHLIWTGQSYSAKRDFWRRKTASEWFYYTSWICFYLVSRNFLSTKVQNIKPNSWIRPLPIYVVYPVDGICYLLIRVDLVTLFGRGKRLISQQIITKPLKSVLFLCLRCTGLPRDWRDWTIEASANQLLCQWKMRPPDWFSATIITWDWDFWKTHIKIHPLCRGRCQNASHIQTHVHLLKHRHT